MWNTTIVIVFTKVVFVDYSVSSCTLHAVCQLSQGDIGTVGQPGGSGKPGHPGPQGVNGATGPTGLRGPPGPILLTEVSKYNNNYYLRNS